MPVYSEDIGGAALTRRLSYMDQPQGPVRRSGTKLVVRIGLQAILVILFVVAALLGTLGGVLFAYAGDLPQITALESQKYNQQLNNAFLGSQQSYKDATRVFNKLVAVTPDDQEADEPLIFLQLAQAAQSAGDLKAAITAYERYLEVAPDSASAPAVKAQLPALRNAANPKNQTGNQ